jgi:hypothetical protein
MVMLSTKHLVLLAIDFVVKLGDLLIHGF